MDFYSNLSPFSNFRDAARSASYHAVPDDWWVIITDVVNSGVAISKGKYREVNTAGAIAIIALQNRQLHRYVPFVFGGDGVTMLCPPECLEEIKDLLHCVRQFVKENFDLILRIGLVSVAEIYKEGLPVTVGKFSQHSPFQQAMFWGEGFDYAEKLTKDKGGKYLLSENHEPTIIASYAGYSCPFTEVKSELGNVISLIVKKGTHPTHYENTITELIDLLGNEKDYFPVSFKNIEVGKTPSKLSIWTTMAAKTNKGPKHFFIGLLLSLLTRYLSRNPAKLQESASQSMPPFSDHRKFDGALKMIINCSDQKLAQIKQWLDEKEHAGEILYGLHQSDSSLITCLFNGMKNEKELHLIDGSNGGYALASEVLKAKIAEIAKR